MYIDLQIRPQSLLSSESNIALSSGSVRSLALSLEILLVPPKDYGDFVFLMLNFECYCSTLLRSVFCKATLIVLTAPVSLGGAPLFVPSALLAVTPDDSGNFTASVCHSKHIRQFDAEYQGLLLPCQRILSS